MFNFIYGSKPAPKVAPVDADVKPPLDLSHHLSQVTKNRHESEVKKFYKYFAIPGIGNLAGGLPNPSYFPYDTLEATTALPDRFEPTPNHPASFYAQLAATHLSSASSTSPRVLVPHASPSPDLTTKIDLSTALQYGQANGYPPLLSFLRQFTRENLHPNVPYLKGPEIILTNGSTDGFSKALECLSNTWDKTRDWVSDRQGILCEEFAYMNAIQTAAPRGLQIVPVKIDVEGMLASGPGGLEDLLQNWDASKGKRPHLMYTVTIGQNPTSGTLSVGRRKEIYALCSKYDIIIIEDDPYWYLQFPSAASSEASARNLCAPSTPPTSSSAAKSSGFPFLDSLVPSYLSVDTEGRVLRLDTFSKIIAPGCRLGWITAQPALIERIHRITEGTTQQPSGFVQAMVAEMILGPQSKSDPGRGGAKDGSGWKVDGWVRWLEGLRGEYERRMQVMCTALEAGRFTVKQQRMLSAEEAEWAVVSKVQMYDFAWPSAGMFVWVRVNFAAHPLFGRVEGQRLAKAMWVWLTRSPYLVIAAPGQMFSPTPEIAEREGWKFLRLCFAAMEKEEVRGVSERFAKGVEAFWQLRKVGDVEEIEEPAQSVVGGDERVANLGVLGCARWV